MNFVLGVDGGNTKTLALVARDDGTILGTGRAGCSDIYGATSPAAAIAEIEQAVNAAFVEAGIPASQLNASVFSLAGADWPEDFQLLEDAIRARCYGQSIRVVNDAIGARHSDGRVWHSSFWQEPQGAEDLSLKALDAVYRAELGIDLPTALTKRILEVFGANTVEEVLHRMTARDLPRPQHRRQLVRPLFDAADAGDATARRIVITHGKALGEYAIVAARRVGLLDTPFPLVLTGGVLRHPSPLLREALVGRVREAAPAVRPIQSRFEPAVGAVLLAFESACINTDAILLERLGSTLPGAAFFAT